MTTTINADNGVSSGSAGLKSSADSSGVLALQTNGTTALSIDASQNVSFTNQPTYSGGIANGVAYLNGSKVLTTGSALVFDGSQLSVLRSSTSTALFDEAEIRAVNTGTATANQRVDIAMRWQDGTYNGTGGISMIRESATARSGTLAFCPIDSSGNALTGMRLDSAGNLGLGATPSAWGSGSKALQINSNLSLWSQSSTNNYIYVNAYSDGTNDKYVSTAEAARVRFAGATTIFYYAASGTAGTNISWSESMRIDTSGNLLVGTTTVNPSGNAFSVDVGSGITRTGHANGTASGTAYSVFVYNGGAIGTITQNGTTAVAYNTSSDYRLKNTIAPMTGALAKVAMLKPVTYKWNADGSDGEGFIAHELAEVCPHAVTGEKDAIDSDGNPQYQGIDTSFLVATLTAAIQEQQALITQLQADVAALKGASA